ncbi:DUF6541 family protein [Microbacterium sp. P04]|uniref:DUF6541 family protein n=1 Tax=Microbacterium sp. P04 TaxID=3366947 RepID=UPI003745D60F
MRDRETSSLMYQDVLDWVPAIAPIFIFALLLIVPGALVLWGAGLTIRRALAFAPVTSTALAGGGAVVLSVMGIPWSAVSYGALAVVAFLIVVGLRWLIQRSAFRLERPQRLAVTPTLWWAVGGLLVNAVAVVWLYVRPTGAADSPSYEYDTIWHFSVIRWITKTGDASSLHTGLLDGTVGNHFYPAAWHSLVALTSELTGSSTAAAVHGSVLFLVLAVWPIGLVWLYRTLFGTAPTGAFAVSALAFLPAVFPIGFFAFGLLYPNFFSYALAPACLVVLIQLLRAVATHSWRDLRASAVGTAVAVVSVPVAILFAQPNSAFTLLVILLPILYTTVARFFSADRLPRAPRWAAGAAVAAFSVVLAIAWVVLHDSSFLARTVAVDVWNKYQSHAQAVGEWIFFGNGTEGQLLLGALAVTGIVLVFVTRQARWWAISYGLLGALFVVSSGFTGGPGSLRSYLVGFWYADSTRLAAAGAIVALPLIAFAIVTIAGRLSGLLRQPGARAKAVAVAGVVAVTFAFSIAESPLEWRVDALREKAFTGDEQWVSPAEESFLSEVEQIVGPDAVVANNPFDGSAMAYSLFGIQVLFPALPGNWMGVPSADQQIVMSSLNEAADDPEVCRAVNDLGVEYVVELETGERGIFGYVPEMFAGVDVTPLTPGFEEVLRDGDLALYRVTACDG